MTLCIVFATFAALLQNDVVVAQESQVPTKLTAAELWNPYTWFYPYAIAAAEGYRDYYVKAQKATNDLYKQIYATNAFPWRNWGMIPFDPSENNLNGEPNESGQTSGSEQPESNPAQPADTTADPQQNQGESTNSGDNVNDEDQGDDAEDDTQDGTYDNEDMDNEDNDP